MPAQDVIHIEALKVAQAAKDMAYSAEHKADMGLARHEGHEKHCDERQANLIKQIDGLTQAQKDLTQAQRDSSAALHEKMNNGFSGQTTAQNNAVSEIRKMFIYYTALQTHSKNRETTFQQTLGWSELPGFPKIRLRTGGRIWRGAR